MKTIKIIDLLNKIANGEEVPERIKLFSFTYKYGYDDVRVENTYLNENTNERLDNDIFLLTLLNEEVEIVEDTPKEDKKIEQIRKSYDIEKYQPEDDTYIYDLRKLIEMVQDIYNKQSEIIDKINLKGGE